VSTKIVLGERTDLGSAGVADEQGAPAAHDTDPARVSALVAAHGLVVHEIALRSASLEAFVRMTADSVEFGATPERAVCGVPSTRIRWGRSTTVLCTVPG
jgi:hypothetical protein